MKPIRVLVTGAGSGVGQGIVKSLRLSRLPVVIISADISPLNAALYRSDDYAIIPKVEEEDACRRIISVLLEKQVDIVMVGSEFDLGFFAEKKEEIEKQSGALIVVSPVHTICMANDKWKTAEFLRQQGLPFPDSFLPANADDAFKKTQEWGYPCILKPRFGTSSRHVHIIRNERDLMYFYEQVPQPVMQKVIELPRKELSHEYTCSIFACRDGRIIGPFTSRRTLRGGSSWIIEVDSFEWLHPLLKKIGSVTPSMGTLNIQLMAGPDGPVPFEFNARFSGTTAIRAYFGFNEPEMAIKNFYLNQDIDNVLMRKGLVLRYLEEVFIDDVTVSELFNGPLPKGTVNRWF